MASINGNLGVSLTIGGVPTRISEDDQNKVLGVPTNNFVAPPTADQLLAFFRDIQAKLEDGQIHHYFHKNELPEE